MRTFAPISEDPPRLPDGFDVPFADAIAWARERRAMLPAEFYGARAQAVRARGFAISGLAALDQVQAAADSLAEATASGQTLREWQRGIRESAPDVFSLGKARRELIFRNAVQTHYGIGRTIQQRENAAARPYLMWDAINDSRTRPAHRAMDGHIAPIDDPVWEKWTPPAGHRCFLPGTRVRGDFRIGLEAPYSGPAVEVLTSSGARLAVTGNHPVVTSDGWVAAKDIKVGDDLLRYGGVVDPLALAVEDDQQSPPTVEQVFEALACEALGVADPAAFELHGDAQFGKGEVHVAGADGELMHGVQVVRDHRRHQRSFEAACDRVAHGSGHAERSTLVSARAALAVLAQYSLHVPLGRADGLGNDGRTHREQLVQPRNDDRERLVAPIGSAPGGAALALDGVAVALDCGPLHQLGLAASANLRPVPNEQRAHGAADNAGLRGKGLLARAFTVLAQQFGHVLGRPLRSRLGPPPAHGVAVLRSAALDAGIAKQTAEQAVTHGGLFKALTHGFPGEVSTDQVISVRHFTFSGHVYDFETAQGWLVANDVIVSNCRCTRISLTEAQARARGYPKVAPAVEPDAGWAGDPTEGNEDLVRVIQARQASCATTFAAKQVRARGVWCDATELARRVEALALAVQNAPMTEDLMRRSLGSELFDRAAIGVLSRGLPSDVSAAGLSLVEKVAIHVWTLDTSGEPWFARINAMMRMADLSPEEYEAVFPVAHALHAGLLKLPPFVGTVFRGVKEWPIGAEDFEQFVRNHETQPEVYHPGFVGASAVESERLRGRAVLILESKTGRDISSLSAKPEQREVLFMPSLKMAPQRVVRRGKVVEIWASEI